MKYRWDKKYLYWGVTAFIVIVAGLLFYYFLFKNSSVTTGWSKIIHVMMPVIDGFILAYLLTPILNFVEAKILKPICKKLKIQLSIKNNKRIRALGIVITLIIASFVLSTFFRIVVPQIVQSIRSIIYGFPDYTNKVYLWIEKVLSDNPDVEKTVMNYVNTYSTDFQKWLSGDLLPQLNVFVRALSTQVVSFVVFFWNLIIGLIISVYMMGSKELFAAQTKKILYSICSETKANSILDETRFIHKTFGGFITGKLLDSLIIGILCFIVTSFLGTPYAVLVSVIVGVTNVIPFFGPYLGAIPSAFLILLVDPKQCLIFLIFILILQQFDGNILGPKILGDSTGLSGFWVIFSITIFGGIFGILGMFIGVPVFAVIYAGIRRKVEFSLAKKDLPESTNAYMKLRHVHNKELQLQENPSESTKGTADVPVKIILKTADFAETKNTEIPSASPEEKSTKENN